jgi:hypothetical protein
LEAIRKPDKKFFFPCVPQELADPLLEKPEIRVKSKKK